MPKGAPKQQKTQSLSPEIAFGLLQEDLRTIAQLGYAVHLIQHQNAAVVVITNAAVEKTPEGLAIVPASTTPASIPKEMP